MQSHSSTMPLLRWYVLPSQQAWRGQTWKTRISGKLFFCAAPPCWQGRVSVVMVPLLLDLQSAIASCFFLFCLGFGVKELSLFPALSCTYLPVWTSYLKAQHGWRNLWMSLWCSTEKFLSLACLKIKQRKSIQSFFPILLKENKALKTPLVEKKLWWLPSHALGSK